MTPWRKSKVKTEQIHQQLQAAQEQSRRIDKAAGRADRDVERVEEVKDTVAEFFRKALQGRHA